MERRPTGILLDPRSIEELTRIRYERDWDEAQIEQSLREAIFVVDSLVYLSGLPNKTKDELWKYREKWARALGIKEQING